VTEKKPTDKVSARPINYDKFTWQVGDLVIEKAPKKPGKSKVKKEKEKEN
jgi:hypothetical protein